jgi:hypothetical protein
VQYRPGFARTPREKKVLRLLDFGMLKLFAFARLGARAASHYAVI